MGLLDHFKEKYYGIAASASLVAGGLAAAVTVPALGLGGILIGTGVTAASMVGSVLFRKRDDDFLNQLNGTADLDEILAITSGKSTMRELTGSSYERGDQKNDMRSNHDRTLIREIGTFSSLRRETLGEEFLGSIASICVDLVKISHEDKFLNFDPASLMTYDSIVMGNLLSTITIFTQTPNDEKISNKFREQLALMGNAATEILAKIDLAKKDKFNENGFYLDQRYGRYRDEELDSSDTHKPKEIKS